LVFWSCEETIDPDTTPPQINIASPIDGATVSDTVVIKTIVADNDAIKFVEFFIDGDLLTTVSKEPFQTDWNTTESSNGEHTLQCKAVDNSDNEGLSESISVTISNGPRVIVQSNPSGASIDLNGTPTGYLTPHTFKGLSLGVNSFRVYINSDYSELDTTLYFTEINQSDTIIANIYPLWDYEWTGTAHVSNGSPFIVPCGEKTVPSTLDARIEIIFTYDTGGWCPLDNFYFFFGGQEYSVVDCGSPCILEKGEELVEGQSSDLEFALGCSSGPDFTINSVILSTE